MTMSEVIEKANAQLAALRETGGQLDEEVICSLFRKELRAALLASTDLEEIARQWAETWNMHVGEADLATITLLDVQPGPAYQSGGKTGMKICVGTWTDMGYKGFVGTYPELTVIWGRDAGEPPAKIIDRNFGLWVAILGALKVQETQGLTVVDRWLAAPEQFRAAHPICPQCGASSVQPMDYGHGLKPLVCGTCGWHVNDPAVNSVEALVQEKVFRAELAAVQKAREAEAALQKQLDVLAEQVKELPRLVEEYRRYRLPSGDMARAMQAIGGAISDSTSLMRGVYLGPQGNTGGDGDERED